MIISKWGVWTQLPAHKAMDGGQGLWISWTKVCCCFGILHCIFLQNYYKAISACTCSCHCAQTGTPLIGLGAKVFLEWPAGSAFNLHCSWQLKQTLTCTSSSPTFSRASGSGLKLEQQYCEQLPIITIMQTIIGHLPPVMNLGKRYGWQLKLFL